MVLLSCTLQIESPVLVDDLEQGLVFWLLQTRLKLPLERLFWAVGEQLQLVSFPKQNHLLLSLERPLRQVATLVVKKPMRVSAPRDPLHQDAAQIHTNC